MNTKEKIHYALRQAPLLYGGHSAYAQWCNVLEELSKLGLCDMESLLKEHPETIWSWGGTRGK